MTNDTTKLDPIGNLDPTLTKIESKETNSNEEINKNEFLTLLVTQLQHQDPLEPMDNEQFAVNLAQFSQVEQLIEINNKLGTSGSGDFSSMAAYLGHEVTINSDMVDVKGNDGGKINFKLDQDAMDAKVELLNAGGAVIESVDLGNLNAGNHSVNLSDLNTNSGEYQVRVVASAAQGGAIEAEAHVSGVVSGFIPGAEPMLVVGDKEVAPSEIIRVGTVNNS